jgi:hypothetical protein
VAVVSLIVVIVTVVVSIVTVIVSIVTVVILSVVAPIEDLAFERLLQATQPIADALEQVASEEGDGPIKSSVVK